MLAADSLRMSLVDWTSFVVMHERRVDRAFAFDDDFRHRGWTIIPD